MREAYLYILTTRGYPAKRYASLAGGMDCSGIHTGANDSAHFCIRVQVLEIVVANPYSEKWIVYTLVRRLLYFIIYRRR